MLALPLAAAVLSAAQAATSTECNDESCLSTTESPLPQRISSRLAARLSDSDLASTVLELLSACDAREACALSMERLVSAAAPLAAPPDDDSDFSTNGDRSTAVEVSGMDAQLHDGSGIRLLFGTPLFSATLDGADELNAELATLIEAERPAAAARQRSMTGPSSFRTDDHFLSRPDPAVRALRRKLLLHAERALQYGQPTPLDLELELYGWAISHGRGGGQVPHVHPLSSWSGIYYVSVPRRIADRATAGDGSGGGGSGTGGCLRLTDPRPAAMMVTLGANDAQFTEGRTVCPTPGLLVMFPSWLSHSVDRLEDAAFGVGADSGFWVGGGGQDDDDGDERRVAVAFNVHGWERKHQRERSHRGAK